MRIDPSTRARLQLASERVQGRSPVASSEGGEFAIPHRGDARAPTHAIRDAIDCKYGAGWRRRRALTEQEPFIWERGQLIN